MELKSYQQHVLGELKDYIAAVAASKDVDAAWRKFWADRDVPVTVAGGGGMRPYSDDITGVPNACIKVPTGGGKTFIAANAVRTIFDALPFGRNRFVLWLVPSDAILTQTTLNLQNPDHPYRQKLNADFGGKVNVYTKEQLLNGQCFSPDDVQHNLSVCVLCYASIRAANQKQADKKIYQENGNLMKFAEYFQNKELILADTPDTALIQVIRQLRPVVIVDESHNAKSELSIEMLKNVNPSFILSMTATPNEKSNIIACVDARELKKEHMVKLPVVVYNRPDIKSVILDAVKLQALLELKAKEAEQNGADYVRPIVLFQAQPKTDAKAETFDRLKEKLVAMGIAAEKIAIKTSQKDEIGKTNLLGKDCPVRFIITVNALKEGWDCPFAYVLASLANRTSKTDVEQIVGRVLRQPYAHRHPTSLLNMSYVLASSIDFQETVKSVVDGLNRAGFSKADYRVADSSPVVAEPVVSQGELGGTASVPSEDAGADATERVPPGMEDVSNVPALMMVAEDAATYVADASLKGMTATAEAEGNQYEEEINAQPVENPLASLGVTMAGVYKMSEQFKDDATGLKLPQFVVSEDAGIFGGLLDKKLLEPENLLDGFTLEGKDATVVFSTAVTDAVKIDVSETGEAMLKSKLITKQEMDFLTSQLSGKSEDERLKKIADAVAALVDKKVNGCPTGQVLKYVRTVVSALPASVRAQLAAEFVPPLARCIEDKIDALQADYRKAQFLDKLNKNEIKCEARYEFPESIRPVQAVQLYEKSLYTGEYDMDGDESALVQKIAALPNVKWWHRIKERVPGLFKINGYRPIFPDFIVRTQGGCVILVEVKGNYLNGSDAKDKMALGKRWAAAAGQNFKYFMVFKNPEDEVEDAMDFNAFLNTLQCL